MYLPPPLQMTPIDTANLDISNVRQVMEIAIAIAKPGTATTAKITTSV